MNLIEELKKAKKFLDAKEPDEAWDVIDPLLREDPNDPRVLLAAAEVQEKSRRITTAYQFAERAVHKAPNISGAWLMFGRMADLLYRFDEAEMAYKKSLEIAPDDVRKATALMNLGGLYITKGMWEEAEKASRQALELKPDAWMAKGNLGMACLGQRKWLEGWKGYESIVGSDQRKLLKYANESTWMGEKRKTVVVYGEQGMGDEISFASMLPDLIRDSKKVIVDCDKRLVNLFKRSFPEAKVYGTRWNKDSEGRVWDAEDTKIDASITMGGLGRYYRLRDEDFPGKPYLIPDPDRVTMWKALFDKQRPSIGIAWSGGVSWTAAKFRKWNLAELTPLFKSAPAHWVSLQYKDASKEIADFPVTQYKYGTLTNDYDDTAALVASLDLVICMQTAVAHLAGALGKECWVFVPNISQWRYGQGDTIPWYKSVKVFRQRDDGTWPLEEAAKLLSLRYARAA
jgi:hypothetical protein